MTESTTTMAAANDPTPVDELSLACIDADSRNVDWDTEKLLDGEWGYHQSFTYTHGDQDLVLIARNDTVEAVYTANGERIDVNDYDDYLDEHSDGDGEPLPGSLTQQDLDELREVTPAMFGSEGPMMNYFYPLNERSGDSIGRYGNSTDEVGAAYLLRNVPLCVVDRDGELGLALTGGGMDLTWEICAAYVALGYLPPVAFCRLPGMAGMPHEDGSDNPVVEAVRRSLTAMVARMQARLDEHNERYPAPGAGRRRVAVPAGAAVFVMTYEHRHGTSVSAYASVEGVTAEKARIARDGWDSIVGKPGVPDSPPADDDEAIEIYYPNRSSETVTVDDLTVEK